MRYIIVIANNKGGTGKTTTTFNLALALGEAGLDVLAVDLDDQADLTRRFGYQPPAVNIGDLMLGNADWEEVAIRMPSKRITLLPSGRGLESNSMLMAVQPANLRFLKPIVADWDGPVLIDCPPSLGILTANAMAAADGVIIATEPEPDSIDGAFRTEKTLDELVAIDVAKARLIGSVAFSVRSNTNLHRDGLREIGHLQAPTIGEIPQRQNENFMTDNAEAYAPIAQEVMAIIAGQEAS